MSKYLYNDYVRTLSRRFEAKLSSIEAVHNFDYGDEFEVVLCEALRSLLPTKYGICRGFVVDRDGNTAGDDVIIFDQERFPTLQLRNLDDYARKEQIPIEAVYAYIEAKHTLVLEGGDVQAGIVRANEQVTKVKNLCSQREQVWYGELDPYLKYTSQKKVGPKWLPSVRNPVFGAIFARHVAHEKQSNRIVDSAEIHKILMTTLEFQKDTFATDLIVAGRSNLTSPGYVEEGELNPCLLLLPGREPAIPCFHLPDTAFGFGLAHLLAVLDWMRLGKMPWEDILNDRKQ